LVINLALTVGAAEPFWMVSTVAELVEAVEPAGMEAKAVTPNGRYSQRKRLLQRKLKKIILHFYLPI
jgi:hypothetical protein